MTQKEDKYFEKLRQKEEKNKKKQQQKELDQLAATIKAPEEPKKEIDYLKYSIWLVAIIVVSTLLIVSVIVISKAGGASPDESLIGLIYIIGSGWFLFLPSIPIFFIARKEIWNKLKIFGRRNRVIILRFIGGDSNEIELVTTLKANTMEIGENKVIINPRKATIKDGIKVITYVADNALAHDYRLDPEKTLKEIASKIGKAKTEDFHDVFSDPIRVDAKYFNETFLAAQQTNPDILKKIIAFLTSKNVLGLLGLIALLAGAAALFGMQANNILNTIPICATGTIVP